MFEYICKDIAAMLRYVPYGLLIGIPVAGCLLLLINRRRRKKEQECLSWPLFFLWCIAVCIMLLITLLSRESGTSGTLDLELFSTLKINTRNNAYVAENVLLFIPYGVLTAANFKRSRNLFYGTAIGLITSFLIETTQLVTERGVFQIDDILSNGLGMLLGIVIYHLLHFLVGRKKQK